MVGVEKAIRGMPNAGWTLIELLVGLAILGIVASIGPQLMVGTVRFSRLQTARTEVQRDARTYVDLISRKLRQARSGTIIIDQVAGQPPYSRVTFRQANGEDLALDEEVVFYQSGGSLYLQTRPVGSASWNSRELTKNLRYLAFTYPRTDEPTILSLAVSTEVATYEGGTKALQLSLETVRLMN